MRQRPNNLRLLRRRYALFSLSALGAAPLALSLIHI